MQLKRSAQHTDKHWLSQFSRSTSVSRMLLRRTLLLLSLIAVDAFGFQEIFSETLELKPLADGKVYAHFTFTTVVHDASPRDATTLKEDDQGEHSI
jgi:hypothetical protein